MKIRNKMLLFIMLLIFLSSLVAQADITADSSFTYQTETLTTIDDQITGNKITSSNQEPQDPVSESKVFLDSVQSRLDAGEDPSTNIDAFIHWSATRKPDYPAYVTEIQSFDILPMSHVRCALGDANQLPMLEYVDKVSLVYAGSNVAASYATNPYVGDWPLLLNETASLVNNPLNSTAGDGVIVAILSTGINDNHPMLNDQDDLFGTVDPKIIASFDAYEYSEFGGVDETNDNNGRGTALASIVSGTNCCGGKFVTDIDLNFPYPYGSSITGETQELSDLITVGSQMGMAPSTSLFDVKITTDAGGTYTEASAITGLEWAVEHGADVVLLDVENFGPSISAIVTAIEAATTAGSLIVVPSGDYVGPGGYIDDNIAPYYTINAPASAPSALTVGATTEKNALWLSSQRGPVSVLETSKPDLVAPGTYMIAADYLYATNDWDGTDADDTLYYDIFTGTHVAAAVAAGVSARLIQAYPGATATAVKIALRQGATDLGFNEMAQGKGLINYQAALARLDGADTVPHTDVRHTQSETFTTFEMQYNDFVGKQILVDGSYTLDTLGSPVFHDWTQNTNGNLESDGFADWQFPYDDTQNQYTWYNITYPGAEQIRITIDERILATGDNITIYSSTDPNDPTPTQVMQATTNTTVSTDYDASAGHTSLFFAFGSDGDGYTTGKSEFGIYGHLELAYYASTTKAEVTNEFEFDSYITALTDMGADVEYWYANSANAPPTSTILEYYDAYIIPQPRASLYYTQFGQSSYWTYYTNMSLALDGYLNLGGQALFIGDYEFYRYDNATGDLGITWNEGGVGGPTTNFGNTTLTTYPFTINELVIGAPYTYLSGGTTLVWDGNVPTISYTTAGSGRLVVMADEDMFNDESWQDPFGTPTNGNSQLAMNLMYNFCDVTYESGPSNLNYEGLQVSSYDADQLVVSGEPWNFDFTLRNSGNYTTQGLYAMAFDWGSIDQILGVGATGNPADGVFNAAGEDNANDTWDLTGDGDIATAVSDTQIEFYYNISESFDVNQVVFPYIEMRASGMDRQTAECNLYVNGILLSPLYETNTTAGGAGDLLYSLEPTISLQQYNNEIRIDVPAEIDLTLISFSIRGLPANDPTESGVLGHELTDVLAPGEEQHFSLSFTPDEPIGTEFYPELRVIIHNMTHAYVGISPPGGFSEYEIAVDYGDLVGGYYNEPNSPIYTVPKTKRTGDSPILYDMTPTGDLGSDSSTKIAKFPGDLRIDGVTVMSSLPVTAGSLRLTGGISDLASLGNYSEATAGDLASYSDSTIAPNYFYVDEAWIGTTTLALDSYEHTYVEPVLQTLIPDNVEPGSYTGTINLYNGSTNLYSKPLSVQVQNPAASFLLYDLSAVDSINTDRNYDKLWDQYYEVWKIATEAGYDIDSLYQAFYLYNFGSQTTLTLNQWIQQFISNVPVDEELIYAGVIGAGLDTSATAPFDDFMDRGGNVIQFGVDHYCGPTFSTAISYQGSGNTMLTVVEENDHPLMEGVETFLYAGGGYMNVDQTTDDLQATYEVLSGENWLSNDNINELAVIYHDAILPDQYGYEAGTYTQASLNQDYAGMKLIVGTDAITQSWFLEQIDVWAFSTTNYAVEQGFIEDNVQVDGNRQFIENIFHVAANQKPQYEAVSVTPNNVVPGDMVHVEVNVTDDRLDPSELTVLIPQKLEPSYRYVEMTYNVNKSTFEGSFAVVDTSLIRTWNIVVFDEFYNTKYANDDYVKRIPYMNNVPVAALGNLGYTENQNLFINNVEKGDLLTLTILYEDIEDEYAVTCNVTVYRYINTEKVEPVYQEVFQGLGQGTLFLDTTNFQSGSYVIIAEVTDTSGGSGTYRLAAFNIGKGTMFKPAPKGLDLFPIALGGGTLLGLGALGAAGYYLYSTKISGKTP